MKNVRVKVREGCTGTWWDFAIFDGRKRLFAHSNMYERKGNAIKYAKVIAERIGIKYDPEIIKLHDC